MIYNSEITSIYENDSMLLLENTEDRFENDTMAEAIAITLGEQEENWTRLMKGIGLSELSSIMEGEEVIYESNRLINLLDKVKGFLERVLSKLADITKTFLNKLAQFVTTNNQFLKMYKSKLNNLKNLPQDLEMEVYDFKGLEEPTYNTTIAKIHLDDDVTDMELRSKKEFIPNITMDDNFKEKLREKYFGEDKRTVQITNDMVKKQVKVLEETKKLREDAKKSYKKAHNTIKKQIDKLNKSKKHYENANSKNDSERKANQFAVDINEAFLTYWKSYASCCQMVHGTYMRAIGTKARQAKAICTKALNASIKETGKNKREKIKARTEGFIDTDVFLGGVEFI